MSHHSVQELVYDSVLYVLLYSTVLYIHMPFLLNVQCSTSCFQSQQCASVMELEVVYYCHSCTGEFKAAIA